MHRAESQQPQATAQQPIVGAFDAQHPTAEDLTDDAPTAASLDAEIRTHPQHVEPLREAIALQRMAELPWRQHADLGQRLPPERLAGSLLVADRPRASQQSLLATNGPPQWRRGVPLQGFGESRVPTSPALTTQLEEHGSDANTQQPAPEPRQALSPVDPNGERPSERTHGGIPDAWSADSSHRFTTAAFGDTIGHSRNRHGARQALRAHLDRARMPQAGEVPP